MNVNQKKRELQLAALDRWRCSDRRGTVNLATGMGKTFVFLDACNDNPNGEIKLFLAETAERELDLRRDIEEYRKLYGIDHSDIVFECYQTAYKWEGKRFGTVGADEIHFAMTPMYSKFFENNECMHLVGLSATVDNDTDYGDITKNQLLRKYAPVCFRYDMNQGIKDGIGRPLNIHVVYHRLDSQAKTIEAGNKDNRFFQTEAAAYNYADRMFRKGIVIRNEFLIKRYMQLRMRLLHGLPSKVRDVTRLLSLMKDKRVILFGNDLHALEKITPHVVRSARKGEKKKERDEINRIIRHRFETSEINTIGSFIILEQGANLKGADSIIMMSYYSDDGRLLQRIGRLRKDEEKIGDVIIFVTIGTQEESWFSSMMEGIDKDVVNVMYYHSIDDLSKRILNLKN